MRLLSDFGTRFVVCGAGGGSDQRNVATLKSFDVDFFENRGLNGIANSEARLFALFSSSYFEKQKQRKILNSKRAQETMS